MSRTPIPEAKLVDTGAGLAPEGDGWFVVNIADAEAFGMQGQSYGWIFEGRENRFPHFGVNVHVLQPGDPSTLYHAEEGQEAFLVLLGECVLVVEDEERHLRQWDFFYSAPWTAHAFAGAGDGPCAILMIGARNAGEGIVYPVSEAAGRHGTSAVRETSDAMEAYTTAGWQRPQPESHSWPPG
jgi:uncharacterized cupin superfamily protein